MRKIKTVLYMKWSLGKSNAVIASSIGVSSSTVHDYLKRAELAKITESQLSSLNDDQLDELLFPSKQGISHVSRGEIDWSDIHKELKRKGMTLQLLWHEYREQHQNGYGYSYFCDLYRKYCNQLDVWMRQHYKAGEKAFVDYCGMTMEIVIDVRTGEKASVQVFVMVLGASGYAYVEATLSQTLPDWLSSHRHAFEFFGGVVELLIPDNLKSGVNKCHRYDPQSNPSYHDLARHYGVAIMPARSRSPQDKDYASYYLLL